MESHEPREKTPSKLGVLDLVQPQVVGTSKQGQRHAFFIYLQQDERTRHLRTLDAPGSTQGKQGDPIVKIIRRRHLEAANARIAVRLEQIARSHSRSHRRERDSALEPLAVGGSPKLR